MDGNVQSEIMKHKIVELIAFMCYWLGIDALFYFLNRKAKRIITFHNVMPEHLLPEGKRIGLTDNEDEFRMMICEIRKHFEVSTDVLDPKTATITFDDGYKNQQEVAGSILSEFECEGIIFGAGKVINNDNPHEALIVDLLLHWTELADDGSYVIPMIRQGAIELTADNRGQVWQKYIWPTFVKDSESKGQNLLEALDSVYPIKDAMAKCSDEYLRLRMTGITDKDIAELQAKGWQVGWHTYNHYSLSSLSVEDQKREIDELAPADIKQVVFSYPYGELESVNADSIRVAEEAGYPCAVSNVSIHNDMMCKHFLPRIMLFKTYTKCQIHFELSGAKYFIQNKKLLPIVR